MRFVGKFTFSAWGFSSLYCAISSFLLAYLLPLGVDSVRYTLSSFDILSGIVCIILSIVAVILVTSAYIKHAPDLMGIRTKSASYQEVAKRSLQLMGTLIIISLTAALLCALVSVLIYIVFGKMLFMSTIRAIINVIIIAIAIPVMPILLNTFTSYTFNYFGFGKTLLLSLHPGTGLYLRYLALSGVLFAILKGISFLNELITAVSLASFTRLLILAAAFGLAISLAAFMYESARDSHLGEYKETIGAEGAKK